MKNEIMHLAFATYDAQPNLSPDDQELAQYLSTKGIKVAPAVWDDENIDWLQFVAIIIRSTWDYMFKERAFDRWLSKLSLLGCRVLNPLIVAQWNKHKSYFNEFEKKGILLPPFHYCRQNSQVDLEQILRNKNWQRAVVKPAVSGGALNTWVTTAASASGDTARFNALLEVGDVIVQQFMDEIITEGELSMIFFNKQFSHAVCKKALPGDFRVQTQFGGTTTPVFPDKKILEKAQDLINSIDEQLLYARVDGVIGNNGDFYLMELELIEPFLYIGSNAKASENFFNAISEILLKQPA